jgi:hypothetical protein
VATLFGIYFSVMVLSDDGYRLDENCQATGWYTSLVAATKKETFWRIQLKHIDNQIAELGSTVPNIFRLMQERRQLEANLNLPEQMFRENPQQRPPPAKQYANALRKQADVIEENASLIELAFLTNEKLKWVRACREMVHIRIHGDS